MSLTVRILIVTLSSSLASGAELSIPAEHPYLALTPDDISRAEGRTARLWIVPASVDGPWHLDLRDGPSFDLTLVQRFQRLEGVVALGGAEASLREPALRGDAVRFGFVDAGGTGYELAGTVSGNRMTGGYEAAGTRGEWTAVRR